MSQPVAEHRSKKRKHAVAADAAGAVAEPSTKRSKKDKDAKRAVKEKAKLDKGKSRATDDAFRVVRATLSVAVPPVFAADLRGGVEEMLDSMLMRYIPALHGVVLAHDHLQFLDKVATIKADCPFMICKVAFDATVWSPQVGMKLVGKINLSSPDHISLLVHRTFNVSIPRHHITTDVYEFEYGPAENDPEFGAGGAEESAQSAPADGAEGQVESGGRWVHKVTETKLGDADGHLEFTVVGLTIANQMLSLVGSIQPDPFSPEHVPKAAVTTSGSKAARPAPRADIAMTSEREIDALIEEAEDSEEEDTFQKLGRLGDEAEAAERRAREAAEEAARKEKKRKRRESKAQETGGDAADISGEKKAKKKKKS